MTSTSALLSGHVEVACDDGEVRQAIRSGQIEVRYLPDGDGRRAVIHWPAGPHRQSESALGGALAEFALHRICRDAAGWCRRDTGHRPSIRLVVAAETFRQRSFVTLVRQALLESGLAPARLRLTLIGTDTDATGSATMRVAEELRAIGISVTSEETDAPAPIVRELANVAQ